MSEDGDRQASTIGTDKVRQRLVLFFPGYEPLDPSVHHHRYGREIRRFDATWQVHSQVGPMMMASDGATADWDVVCEGPNWRADTLVRLMRWDDVIDIDNRRKMHRRLGAYLAAMADFIRHGLLGRYFRAHWRYFLFAIYPLILLVGFTLAGWLAATLVGLVVPLGGWARLAIGALVFAGLLVIGGQRWHLGYMFNDWAFARDLTYQSRPLMEERLDRFAAIILDAARDRDAEEILLVGHSLGAAIMVESLARALKQDPAFPSHAAPFGLVGLGSSTLKIALHPEARWLSRSIETVCNTPGLPWADYDSHLDFISFYKCDLPATLGLSVRHPPRRTGIRLSRMLKPETWRRFALNFLRIHRQYVMGNEQRFFYDFHMLTAGPLSFATITGPAEDWPARFSPDGRLD